MKVKDVMTQSIATCSSTATAADAARQMWENDCGIVPITDEESGRLTGVITDRDACMASLTQDLPLSRIPVTSCMAKNVFHCREDQDVEVAQNLMRKHQVRRIPVVDKDSRIVGIVSLRDLTLKAGTAKNATAKSLTKEVSETLRAICESPPASSGSRQGLSAEA